MRLQRQVTEQTQPSVAPVAPQQAQRQSPYSTGAILAQAGAGLTDFISRYSFHLVKARQDQSLLTAQTEFDVYMREHLSNLQGDTDYDSYVPKTKEIAEKAVQEIARKYDYLPEDAFKAWAQKKAINYIFKAKDLANRGIVDQLQAQYQTTLDQAIDLGDYDKVKQIVAVNVKNGVISAKEGAKHLEAARDRIQYNAAWQEVLQAKNYTEAKQIVSALPLPAEKKNTLLSGYRSEYNFRQARIKEAQRKYYDSVYATFAHKLYSSDEPLTHAEIDQSGLKGKDKLFWHKQLDSYNDRILRNKKEGVSDPNLVMQIQQRLYDPTADPLTQEELHKYVEDGRLTMKDATALWKSSQFDKRPEFKETITALKAAFGYGGPLSGFNTAASASLFAQATMRIREEFAKKPPKPSEYFEKAAKIARPYLDQYKQLSGDEMSVEQFYKTAGFKPAPLTRQLEKPGQEPRATAYRKMHPTGGPVEIER